VNTESSAGRTAIRRKLLWTSAVLGAAFPGFVLAQVSPVVGAEATRVSGHVWAIMGFPNIGIVVGKHAVLVVDTGLGTPNGKTVSGVASRLAPGRQLYLTTTHFHPEHASGEGGFPADAVILRDAVQQQEMNEHGMAMVDLFAGRSAEQKKLLEGVTFRQPDVLFDSTYTLDLGGGVRAQLLWFGGAHTKGDELIYVLPDRTLISGDVVQNKVVPNIFGEGGTPSSWVAVLDRIASLHPRHVLPDHSPLGDGALVGQERGFIVDLRVRALELKKNGVSAEKAGEMLTREFQGKYSDWNITSVSGFVSSVFADPQQ
jgi:glyoxylase-like metal-dependent hydrolase (beta-lactamase superfamily II)